MAIYIKIITVLYQQKHGRRETMAAEKQCKHWNPKMLRRESQKKSRTRSERDTQVAIWRSGRRRYAGAGEGSREACEVRHYTIL